MKPFFSVILILISVFAFNQNKGTIERDSMVKALTHVDLEQFEKKKTISFILQLPSNYKVEISSSNNFNYPYTAVLKFPDRPYVEIHMLYDQLRYTNPNSMFRRKIAKQLKREILQKVKIYDEYMCVNGCDEWSRLLQGMR